MKFRVSRRVLALVLVIVAVLVLVLVLAALAVQRRAQAPAGDAASAVPAVPELSPVDLVTVSHSELASGVQLSGLLRPVRQTQLTAEVDGRLADVRVRAGEKVRAGQVLATLDASDLDSRVAEARANMAAARAQFELAQKNQRRNEELRERNFVSANSVDTSRSELDAAREALRAREAQLSLMQQARGRASVRSPIAGVVAERSVEPGQHVGVNARLFAVVDLKELEFEARLPVSEVGAIRPGLPVRLQVEGVEGSFGGTVERISPVADEASRMIPLYVRVPNPQEVLKGGMVAQGSLSLEGGRKGLTLPEQAIRRDGERAWVLRLASNDGGLRVERRDVTLGLADAASGKVEIRSGLEANDRVVLASVGGLQAGQTVKLVQ